MLSVHSSAFDQENALFSNGKPQHTKNTTTPSGIKPRKALGEITNTPIRKPLSEITNKQPSAPVSQKPLKKECLYFTLISCYWANTTGVKAKRPKEKDQKVTKVRDVERMYSFKHTPLPDLPGFDFDVNQFLVPMVNIPYSLDYPESVDASFPNELLLDIPTDEFQASELSVCIDDSRLTEDLVIN